MDGFIVLCCLFFFKQKTAYEMRISDWSSDVCSSDLRQSVGPCRDAARRRSRARARRTAQRAAAERPAPRQDDGGACQRHRKLYRTRDGARRPGDDEPERPHLFGRFFGGAADFEGRQAPVRYPRQSDRADRRPAADRSEEHTSELQSLMRISYAVFCLKKKKKNEYQDEHTKDR